MGAVSVGERLPGDDVAIDLQKLEELLGLLSVSVLLLRCQGVVGNQQWVGPSSWEHGTGSHLSGAQNLATAAQIFPSR